LIRNTPNATGLQRKVKINARHQPTNPLGKRWPVPARDKPHGGNGYSAAAAPEVLAALAGARIVASLRAETGKSALRAKRKRRLRPQCDRAARGRLDAPEVE
jgi:hypothetical protein